METLGWFALGYYVVGLLILLLAMLVDDYVWLKETEQFTPKRWLRPIRREFMDEGFVLAIFWPFWASIALKAFIGFFRYLGKKLKRGK